MRKAQRERFFRRGGLWVIAQSALLPAVAAVSIYDRETFPPFQFQILLAFLLLGLSAFFGIAGVIALGKNRTAFPAPLGQSELVQTGVYSIVRHPLYVSLMLWAVSWPLFWSSTVGFIGAITVFIFFDCKARSEERLLHQTFPQYASYARHVRRFVPGVY